MKKLLMILSLSIIVFSCEKNQDIGLPVITLIGPLEVFFDVNAAYVEFGYKATDASGRDISDSVICDLSALNMSRSGSYQISYIAVDRLGRKSAAVYRTVHVGIGQSPVITIAGDNPVILALNSEFTPPSATAVSSDGNTDLSESVVVNAETVDTSVPGTYSVYYTVSDTGGLSTTEILTVYVLESDIPRIVVNGDGTTPENPLIIEQLTFDAGVSDEEKQSKAAEAFRKSLPTIKAYDLEDGDISYRVSATENEAYTAVLQAIIDGGSSPADPVTMTVSDKDGNMSAVELYISVIVDSTPPVITIADEQAVYEIEIDMWKDQWSAWETDILGKLSVSVSDDGGTTVEVFPKDGTSESDFATTDSGIKCWIEYPNVINSSTQEAYANSDLQTTLKHSTGENTNCYYYQTPTNEINTKMVLLKAKDSAGNSAEKSIKVFLKDTTPPEILTEQSVVAFGATQYSWDVKDNSGYKTSRSANIPSYTHNGSNYGSAGLIAGTFSVSFSDTDYAKNPVSTTGSLKVNAPSTEDLFSAYGNFAGQDSQGNANEGDAQAFTPNGWMLADAIDAPDNEHTHGYKRYWYEGNTAKEITGVTTIGSSFIICGGIRDKKGTARGYLTCGYRSPVSNVVLGLRSLEVERTLFQNVKYQVSYKHRDFDPITNANGLGGDRYLVVQRRSGNGNFNDNGGTEFRIEWSASSPNDTSGETVIAALRDMKTDQQPFIVRNGNITGFSVLYSIKKSGTSYWDGDYGAIIGNIQIKAIDWPKRQNDGSVVSP